MQRKNKFVAAILALVLGTVGAHRFYLGDTKFGILYLLLLFFTAAKFPLTAFLGIIDFFRFMTMGQSEFDRKYNRHIPVGQQRAQGRQMQRNPYQRNRTKVEPITQPKKSFRTKVNPYKKTALKRYEEFDTEQAVKDLHKALEIEPNNKDLYFKLACAYSQLEKVDNSIRNLDLAIKNGYKNFEEIKKIEDLAYLRISPQYVSFVANNFSLKNIPKLSAPKENLLDNDVILSQLNKLVEMKKRGLLSEEEYVKEKQKLLKK